MKKYPLNTKSKIRLKLLLNISFISLFIMALLIRDILGISISKFFFIGIASLVFIFNNKNHILGFLCFIIPLSTGISYKYIVPIGLVFLILKKGKKINIKLSSLYYVSIIFSFELLSYFYGNFSLIDFIRFVPFMVLILLIMSDNKEDYDHELVLKFFLLGFFIMTIDIIGQTMQHYSINQILSLGVRFGNTKQLFDLNVEGQLVSLNPNSLGLFAALSTSIGLLLYNIKNKKIYIFIVSYGIVFGLMSQSRSFIIVFAIILFLYLSTTSSSIKKTVGSMSLLVLIVFVIYLIGTKVIPEYGMNFIKRFTEVDDLSNGRDDIMSYYYHAFISSDLSRMLVGVGIQKYNVKYNSIMSLHNALMEIVVIWGIIGFMTICLLFRDFFKNATRDFYKNKGKIYFIPTIALLVAIQSGQGFSVWSNILLLIICYSSIRLGGEKLSHDNI